MEVKDLIPQITSLIPSQCSIVINEVYEDGELYHTIELKHNDLILLRSAKVFNIEREDIENEAAAEFIKRLTGYSVSYLVSKTRSCLESPVMSL
jgi:hypothetical protein